MNYIEIGKVIESAKTMRCGNKEYPVLSITKSDGLILQSEKFKKRIASNDTEQYKVVKYGQLVQGIHIDEANFGIQDIIDFGIVSPAYKIWNVKKDIIIPKYLEMILRSPASIRYYASKFNGSIKRRERLTDKDFLAMKIPCPSMPEQEFVLQTIRKTEKLLKLYQHEICKFDELIKARFVEMFGDPVTNEKNWPRLTLGDICEIGSSKRVFEKDYVPHGIPFFRTKEIVELSKGNSISTELFITEEHYAELKKTYGAPKKDDLLISAVGTIGTIWIVNGDFEFYFKDGNLIQIKASPNFNSVFMKCLLDELIANYKKEMSTGTAYSALTIAGLKKMLVYDVPLDLQKQFAIFVEQTDKSKVINIEQKGALI